MKKIKVIGKTMLIAALVASSAQMFASEQIVPYMVPQQIARSVQSVFARTRRWIFDNPKKALGVGVGIELTMIGVMAGALMAQDWWTKENPKEAKELEKTMGMGIKTFFPASNIKKGPLAIEQ